MFRLPKANTHQAQTGLAKLLLMLL
jgi:hypothetical protein